MEQSANGADTPPPALAGWPAESPAVRGSSITIGTGAGRGVELHLLETGPPEAQPVVLVHGNRSWAVTWRRVMAQLGDFRCIAPDLPGFGRSGFLRRPRPSFQSYGAAVADLVERLELEDVLFVAHGCGGLVSAAAGRLCGERFAGGALVNAPVVCEDATPPPVLHRFSRWPRLRDLLWVACGWPPLALAALQTRRGEFQAESHAAYSWPLATRRRRRSLVRMAELEGGSPEERRQAREWLMDFPGPLALVWGHRDPLMPAKELEAQERQLPYARIWRSEAGHFLQEEEPALIAAAVRWTARNSRVAPASLPQNFLPGIGAGDFEAVGNRLVEALVGAAGLRPEDLVLDVGCGLGRTARALRGFLGREGRYEGFDVVPEVVRWCQQNISRLDRRFRFRHAPLHNEAYNPSGQTRAESYRFPYPDESFDFVIANSVFTHLAPTEAVAYLHEIARVLKREGRVWLSSFLIDQQARRAMASGFADRFFPHTYGLGWVEDLERPLHAVAFDHSWLLEKLRRAGLEPSRPTIYGSWRGGDEERSYQDVIVARRIGRTTSGGL